MKRYVLEEGSDAVSKWLEAPRVATSALTRIEISSAVCRRQREGDVTSAQRDSILQSLEGDCRFWTLVELATPVLDAAGSLLRRHSLRAADAIQLASALALREELEVEVAFGVFDLRLRSAAEGEGFSLLE